MCLKSICRAKKVLKMQNLWFTSIKIILIENLWYFMVKNSYDITSILQLLSFLTIASAKIIFSQVSEQICGLCNPLQFHEQLSTNQAFNIKFKIYQIKTKKFKSSNLKLAMKLYLYTSTSEVLRIHKRILKRQYLWFTFK